MELPPRYSVAEYQKWEGDWELIDGYPYAMASAKMGHQTIGASIVTMINNSLKKGLCRDCRVVYELDWIIDQETVVRPDVMVICGIESPDFLRTTPEFIMEILSESTRMKDRNIKFRIYQETGVKYYLLVDPEKKSFEVFELINNQFVSRNNLAHFDLIKGCSFELKESDIF